MPSLKVIIWDVLLRGRGCEWGMWAQGWYDIELNVEGQRETVALVERKVN